METASRAMVTTFMFMRYRIIPFAAERMASAQAAQCQPASLDRAVNSKSFNSIGRTAGIVAAVCRNQGRDKIAICPDRGTHQCYQKSLYHLLPRCPFERAPTLPSDLRRSCRKSSYFRSLVAKRPIRTKSQPLSAYSGMTS